jgi:3-dehydroquinate synthase
MKLSNRIVTVSRTPVFFGKGAYSAIDRSISSLHPHLIFILVDPNTRIHCLPLLLQQTSTLGDARVIEMDGGEASKSLASAERIWMEMLLAGAGRDTLLVNLGGGVVSDLGGFVAAGYKRGINYINVPTTLMAQADAAIGGKTGVNIGNIKNQVGFFCAAAGVFVVSDFLKTLPLLQLRSGLAEIIKTTLISNGPMWRRLQKNPVSRLLTLPVDSGLWQDLIHATVKYKNKVVEKDFREKKFRKVLNFGHTLGHVFESLSMEDFRVSLLHGEAVAAGMICAAYLSHQKAGLSESDMESITRYLRLGFGHFPVDPSYKSRSMELLQYDKKVQDGKVRFTLITKPGFPLLNVECHPDEISAALDYYLTTPSGW